MPLLQFPSDFNRFRAAAKSSDYDKKDDKYDIQSIHNTPTFHFLKGYQWIPGIHFSQALTIPVVRGQSVIETALITE